MKCKTVQNQLSDYLDNLMSDSNKIQLEEHLKQCQKCSSELNAFRMIITEASSFDKAKAPDSLWEGIETQLNTNRESNSSKIANLLSSLKEQIVSGFRFPIPVIQITGVAAILIIGIVIGHYSLPSLENNDLAYQTDVPNGDYQMISSRTTDYVEKSKILFLGLVNSDPVEAKYLDWGTDKRRAQNLIKVAAYLKDNLSEKHNARIRQLIEALELILLEFANLEEEYDIDNIELIKSGIDRQGILLKINMYDLSEQPLTRENNRFNNTL